MDINQIIKGCQKGKRSSQDDLVRLFAPRVMAICLRYCKDRDIANDALQETFIKILKYIKNYKGKGSFEGWIRRIAVNASFEMIKKIRQIKFLEEDNHFNILSTVPDINNELDTQDLMKLIDKLPESQSIVFNLKIIEGYSHEEIAKLLKIKPATSRSNLTRARISMIKLLKASETNQFKTNKNQNYGL